jgi:HD-like signal output (HDOD) protein
MSDATITNGQAAGKDDPALQRLLTRFKADILDDFANERLAWPSIPAVLIEIRRVMRDPEAGSSEVTEAVSSDPALATRLLRVANSMFYSGESSCDSVRAAVVRLGNATVEQVVLMLTVARVFSVGNRQKIQPHLSRLWLHSTRVAVLSEVLAGKLPPLKPDVAMLAGLIHDMGALPVIVQAQKYPTILSNPNILEPLISALRPELSYSMLSEWKFPRELITAVAGHEELMRRGQEQVEYVDLVLVANQLSYMDPQQPPADSPLWHLPAFEKVGIEPAQLPSIFEQAGERFELLRNVLSQA